MELPAQLDELTPAWRDIRQQLRQAVGQSTFEIWLASLQVTSWDGAVLHLQAPSETQRWVIERFGKIVERCARRVIGNAVKVAFEPSPSASRALPIALPAAGTPSAVAHAITLNPRFSFGQFVIGEGNRLAHAAALAVAELPGQAYNPLFLHAPPGLGKTHLLHAIGNYILAFGERVTVRYTTAEAFTNDFITSLSSRSLDRFKHAYRDADVLLIDDIQFLASKAKTGEEFFHTFNALHATGRQLVLTCDRLPHQLRDIEERLRERFEAGLVADIRPPDFPTRLAILRKRAALDQVPLADPQVLELIAERITDNIRALEGALIRLVAHHSLTGRPIDTNLAQTVLRELFSAPTFSRPTIFDVQKAVAAYYELSLDELLSTTRVARVAWPRHLAIYLSREHTGASLHDIGHAFGRRNHATVLNACQRVTKRLPSDSEATGDVENLSAIISGRQSDRRY